MATVSRLPGYIGLDSALRRKQPAEKPLPTPPSPTLTNPELVLPDSYPACDVASYLPLHNSALVKPTYSHNGTRAANPALQNGRGGRTERDVTPARSLRERTSQLKLRRYSPNGDANNQDDSEGDTSTERGSTISSDYGSVLRSSTTAERLQTYDPRGTRGANSSNGGSSPTSDDLAGVAHFLSKYKSDSAGRSGPHEEDDNATTYGDDTASRHSISVSVIENGIEQQRRIQEEDEQTSAILSQRAEEILANAKRKLNLMEGNLRGARELVAPLTAANLKRAASLGSAYHSPFSNTTQFVYGGAPSTQAPSEPARASSAAPDHPGHWRNYSDVSLSDRRHTRTPSYTRRLPVNVSDNSWNRSLRGSQSHDALSAAARGNLSPVANSIDSPLETLQEDESNDFTNHSTVGSESRRYVNGLGISQDSNASDDIRSQMSSLKGRISALKQRAREDSTRRRSYQSLRSKTSMTSVSDEDQTYNSARQSPVPSVVSHAEWQQRFNGDNGVAIQSSPTVPPGRNAFAEQAARLSNGSYASRQVSSHPGNFAFDYSAAHKAVENWRVTATGLQTPISGTPSIGGNSTLYEETEPESDAQSEDGTSIYEDAESEAIPVDLSIIPHEERVDAFDYQEFFLSSAVAAYGARRGSTSSESTTSTATARRPASERTIAEDFDITDGPPPVPQTPERLRAIERDLQHTRAPSSASITTMATFRTAQETRIPDWTSTMPLGSRPHTAMDRSQPTRRQSDGPISRPHTVMDERRTLRERASSSLGRDSDSDRADSGVDFSKRSPNSLHSASTFTKSPLPAQPFHPSSQIYASNNGQSLHRPSQSAGEFPRPSLEALPTPPMSPTDPVARAVNALLGTNGRQLGLKEKALLFGAMENLRRLAIGLQNEDEGSMKARMLRQKLDDARKVLEVSE